jgi:hypothetical protein
MLSSTFVSNNTVAEVGIAVECRSIVKEKVNQSMRWTKSGWLSSVA